MVTSKRPKLKARKNFLSIEKRQQLTQRYKQKRNREAERIQVILLANDGFKQKDIARMMRLSLETIHQHLIDYQEKEKLTIESGGKRASHLNDKQTQHLINHLKEHTYLYVKDITNYVHKTYGIVYSESGMRQWLYAHDFRYKKPSGIPGKVDVIAQENFKKEYENIKAEAMEKDEPVYFIDSVHPQHQTDLAYGWILKGVRKEIPTTGRQKRVNIIGGVCLSESKFVYKEASRTVTTESMKEYFIKIKSGYSAAKKIHIICDNASYHKSKEMQLWSKNNNIILHPLPPYSPNLNIIERLWKWLKKSLKSNRHYANHACFRSAVLKFLKNLSENGLSGLGNLLSDNFQVFEKKRAV